MKRIAWMGAGLLMCGSLSLMATPVDLKVLPGTARWIVHLDMEKLLQSEVGKMAQQAIQGKPQEARIKALEAMTSVNLLRDVHGLTVCGQGASQDGATVLVRGRFDEQRLVTILAAADGYAQTAYGTRSIHGWNDKNSKTTGRTYGAFGAQNLIVMSDRPESVQAALDVLDGKRASLATAGTFSKTSVPGAGFMFLATAKGLRDMEAIHPKAVVMKQVDDMTLTLGEKGNALVLAANVTAVSAEAVTQIQQVVAGFQAMALLGAENKPEMVDLAKSLTFTANDRTLQMEMSCPVQTVIQMIRSKIAEDAQAKPAPSAPTTP